MPFFSHSVDVSKPPADVFPWLLAEDKVPQWTGDLSRYEQQGPLAVGSHVRQVLTLAGGLTLDLEVTRYDPPRGAETRFSTNGVSVVSGYALEAAGAGTRLTQTLDAKAESFTARLLIPVVQGRLEQKIVTDLERLRGLLEA
jgi:Polyketide cyclase / dehydrase and lipid transport